MLVPDFEIIITKTFPAALMLSPFGFVVWRHGQHQEQKVCYLYYYRRRMQMSLQYLTKSLRTFVIPLQSSRKFVYARYCQSATFGRLTFCVYSLLFLRNSRLMSPRPPRARRAHRAHRSAASYMLNCKQQNAVRAVGEW